MPTREARALAPSAESSINTSLGDLPQREAEPRLRGVGEHLGGADVERDERGDDAERAAGLGERDAVCGGELARAEEREGDREEEEEDDEAEVPPGRRDAVCDEQGGRWIA